MTRTHASAMPAGAPDRPARPSPMPSRPLQRRCSCGGHAGAGGECDACRRKRLARHAVAGHEAPVGAAPRLEKVVDSVIRRPGRAIDAGTRAVLQPHYGVDLSRVRLHTDEAAARSARSVDAIAFAAGRHVVFGSGRYAPHTPDGLHLLAHELAHVGQQRAQDISGTPSLHITAPSDPAEREADHIADAVVGATDRPAPPSAQRTAASPPVVARLVSAHHTRCPANANGASATPAADLAAADRAARAQCTATALLLTIAGVLTESGFRNPGSGVDQAYRNTFGLPVPQGRGFLNRLGGGVRPTLNEALGEEMQQLALRYQLMARFFGQPIPYRCDARPFGGCPVSAATCGVGDAASCAGIGAIFLCPTYWGFNREQQTGVLIHEVAHIQWSNVVHGARGSGGNFRHADCYAALSSQIFGTTLAPTGAPCVAPAP